MMNPLANAFNAKVSLMKLDLNSKINKEFTEKDLELAMKIDLRKLYSSNDFIQKMEDGAKQLIFAMEVFHVKELGSINEGTAWGDLGAYCCNMGKMLTNDEELADQAVKCFERSYEIFYKLDKNGKALMALLVTASSNLSSFASKQEISEKYFKMNAQIQEDMMKAA
jgi:hypothetical protein